MSGQIKLVERHSVQLPPFDCAVYYLELLLRAGKLGHGTGLAPVGGS